MRAVTICLALLGAAAGPGRSSAGVAAPAQWSPDGDWIAYVQERGPAPNTFPPGWLAGPLTDAETQPAGMADARTYRLWASHAGSGDHLLLEDSDGPLGSPSWAPTGNALAYVRLVDAHVEAETVPAVELVIQDAPGERRVLHRQELDGPVDDRSRASLSGAACAWSPDGRYLAAPRLDPSGLDIVRVETGNRLRTVNGAFAPAWSPNSTQLAFYRTGPTDTSSLVVMDAQFEEPRALLELPEAATLPAPVWSRDGRSLLVVLRGREAARQPRPGGNPTERAFTRLVRVDPTSGDFALVQDLQIPSLTTPEGLGSATFSLSTDELNLLFATNGPGQPTQITWAQPAREVIQSRFHPIEPSIPLEAFALEPTGQRLALRVGAAGAEGLLALCDPVTQSLTPVVPDEDTRAAWLAMLVETTLESLASIPTPEGSGLTRRVTPLPAPFELGPEAVNFSLLRRLARLGRSLCNPPVDATATDPAFSRTLDEARFFFDYLNHNPRDDHYRVASDSLKVLEALAATPGARFRLACLRAQVEMGRGDIFQARQLILYLRDASAWPVEQFEETPGGGILTPLEDPSPVWLDALDAATRAESDSADGLVAPADPTVRVLRSIPRPAQPPRDDDGRIDDVQVHDVP